MTSQQPMDEQLVGSLEYGNYKASVYSSNVPGEFKVVYSDPTGHALEEAPLTGISTYHQREQEIYKRLRELSQGAHPRRNPDRGDAGEY
ncbi:MAG: hypothetical protein JO270_08860 [Acidobacteriaceae bacterium]|nr:hypothetical protein [Acidobacteriaceae bacterium]MBV8571007.1 hypothetical protein [Acidobacteriaceae bacterium]